VKGLDQYFENESLKLNREGGLLKYLKCPSCNQIISRSSRYNSYIKEQFKNLNEVKSKYNKLVYLNESQLDKTLRKVKELREVRAFDSAFLMEIEILLKKVSTNLRDKNSHDIL
jgi:uncharacterized protein YlbG (UPF0298 family)